MDVAAQQAVRLMTVVKGLPISQLLVEIYIIEDAQFTRDDTLLLCGHHVPPTILVYFSVQALNSKPS
jgi:hypothetical protein